MSPIRRTKAKIGELLLQRGLITSEQLQQALSLQRNRDKDKTLGQILFELGYVSEYELYLVLATQRGYPYIDIDHCTIESDVLSLLPEAVVKRYQVFPIDKIEGILTVAMVNPLDKLAIDQIQKLTESNVKVFLTTLSEFKEAVFRYYGKR